MVFINLIIGVHIINCRLVVRIYSENKDAKWVFEDKYGCSVEHACKLLEFAKELGLSVVGVRYVRMLACMHAG